MSSSSRLLGCEEGFRLAWEIDLALKLDQANHLERSLADATGGPAIKILSHFVGTRVRLDASRYIYDVSTTVSDPLHLDTTNTMVIHKSFHLSINTKEVVLGEMEICTPFELQPSREAPLKDLVAIRLETSGAHQIFEAGPGA